MTGGVQQQCLQQFARAASGLLLSGALVCLAQPVLAQTQTAAGSYPFKPIRMIIPVAPSGGSDALVRMVTAKVTERLGQAFIVENISGAAGLLAVQTVAKAAPDGYTLIICSSSSYNSTMLSGKLEGDARKLLTPVAQLTSQASIMSVNVSLPVHTLPDLIAYGRKNPDGLNFASSGIGSAAHLIGEIINQRAGLKMVHVPYKGIGPGVLDVISGRVQVVFASPSATGQHARAGKIRPIAVISAKRSSSLPDLPTAIEQGLKGVEWAGWFGILAPAGTPRQNVLILNAAINQALALPDVLKVFAADGSDPASGTPEQFGEMLNNGLDQVARIIKDLNIRME